MDIKKHLYWIIFAICLIIFAALSSRIFFHDSTEYITLAKNFAGVHNVDLFSTHSLLYPLIISPFLKIWPSLTMLRLVNCMWVFLIGLVIFFLFNDKRAFLIFAFSPLTWFISIQTTPILPASFFFLLAYFFLKRENLKYNIFYSGFFLGLSYAVYDPILFVAVVFILTYFWDKKFYYVFAYLISVGIGILPRLALDYYLFNMPFYSMIRFFGTNMIISLGLYPRTSNIMLLSNLEVLFIVVIISPFIYKLYNIYSKDYKRDLIFLVIAGLLLLVRCSLFKYFLIIAPISIILLAKTLTNREIKWHCILSVFMIGILTLSYINFFYSYEKDIEKDLNKIISDFPNIDSIIVSPDIGDVIALSTFSWKNKPYFVWYSVFKTSENNKTSIRGYNFPFDSDKINLRDRLVISASFDIRENKTYNNYILLSDVRGMQGYIKDKCYSVLCIYK